MSPQSEFESLREEFKLADQDLKADLLIELADQFETVPERIAKRPYPEHAKIPGCESEAYIFFEDTESAGLHFWFAVENPQGVSAKALATFLRQTLFGRTAEELSAIEESVVYDLFGKNLSLGKGQGLMGMVQAVRQKAIRALSSERPK